MALSPMMVHYQQIKEKHKDCIIFYRLGDFYEMFFEDAIKASKLLDLTLTGRDCGLQERAPMCGIPFHAADQYISKLVACGEKIAICEQLTDPKPGELVQREVIKVVTAGTVTENLDDTKNNFIASIYCEDNVSAVSWADITTGEFFTQKIEDENHFSKVCDLLVKIAPAEIICNEKAFKVFNDSPLVIQGVLPKFYQFLSGEFEISNALETLYKQFNVLTLSSYGLDNKDVCVRSSGALVSYLQQTQKHALVNINSIKVNNGNKVMMLDINAVRNLELIRSIRDDKKYGTLLWLLDKTKTSMGARKLQSVILSPLNSIEEIKYRLDGVECLFNDILIREVLMETLSGFRDIGRLSGKISNNNLTPKDCISLEKSLTVLPNVKFRLSGISSKILQDINDKIKDFSDIVKLIDASISNKEIDKWEYIKTGFNEELDELRDLAFNGKNKISEIEGREREKTGIRTLRIGYNRVFGYYIEVTNSFKDKIPYDYLRKQTLANAERYVTPELQELEEKILSAQEKAEKLELQLFNKIKETLKDYVSDLKETSEGIAELDVILAFATVSRENGYVKPEILPNNARLNIVEGRHPVVEATLKSTFISNDCVLDNDENRMAIITGPNMAGKSTYMRQVALITLMAHIGCFVPAKSAEIPLTDKIFTRIGASDSLISDQSTFMVEMSEMAYILKNATPNSLVILDEIGRGTSTFDGLSIAWAVVEYLTKAIKCRTLFATHYHELTELEGHIDGVKNYKITIKEFQGSIIFLRKIMRGSANRSFGIEVAEIAGVDKEITSRAKQILNTLESSDITKRTDEEYEDEPKKSTSEVERIIKDINIDNLTPIQAFNVLLDLHEKLSEK